MAYLALAFTLFQGLYVNGLRLLLESWHWRDVFLALGIGVAALVIPIFALLMRDKPEDHGLLPDNALSPADADAESNWTLRETLRTPLMWVYVLARMLPSAWGTGLILHQISLFASLNHSARTATETFALITLFSAGAALLAGWMIDRFSPSLVVALQMLSMIGSCLLAMSMTQSWQLAIYALAFGVGMGIGYVFDGAVWANLFGRAFQGEIRGFVFAAVITGSAIGPAVFGLSYDQTGGYAAALLLGAGLASILLLLALLTPLPKRK